MSEAARYPGLTMAGTQFTPTEARAIWDLWVQHGGSWHGPNIETVTMPLSDWWGFLDALLDRAEKFYPESSLQQEKEPTP